MPFFTDDDPGFRQDRATLTPLPQYSDVNPLGAAFRQSNLVVSTINGIRNSGAFEPDPSHNPLDVVRGTKYEQQHLGAFVGSRSDGETRTIMRQIDGEEADRRSREAAGWGGVLLSVIAGVADPTILLPGSIAVKSGRAGYEFTRAAINVGAAGALQVAAQEAGLQATQVSRPLSESAINIGSGTLLAGFLGGAASRLLSPVERATLERSLDRARADMDAHANPQPRAEPVPPGAPPLIPEPRKFAYPAFHGASDDFQQFDPTRLGVNTGAPSAQEGFFFGKSASTAEAYANQQRPLKADLPPEARARVEQLETQLAQEKAGVSTRSKIRAIEDQIEAIYNDDAHIVHGEGGNIRPVLLDMQNPLVHDFRGSKYRDTSYKDIIQKAKSAGHDSVILKNTFDGGPMDDIYVVFRPEQIRSQFEAGRGLGVAQPAGAAAADIRTLEMPTSIPGTSKLSVTRRTLEAESVVARRAMADTAETPYSYKQSAEGVAATQGPPVDRVVKMAKDGTHYQVGQELDRLFTDYRFGADPPKMAQMRAGIDDVLGRGEGKMSYSEFKKAVSEAAMFGDAHEIPQVAAAAQFIRAKAFEPWAVRAEQAVEGFERLTPAPGESWFPHSWNKEKIKAQRPQFADRLTELYKADQQTKAAAKERLTGLSRDLEAAQAKLAKATDAEASAAAKLEHDAVRAKIEEEVAAWQGKSVAEAKSAIKAREKYAEKRNVKEGDEGFTRLESADKAMDRAVKKIIASDRDLSDQELRSVAQQTVDRILGSPDGRLPYDVFKGGPQPPGGGAPQRGSLAERQLNVTNAWAREWIEDDIEHVVNTHLRTVVPDVVLAERHGDVEMTQVFRAINEDYAKLIDAARGNEKKVAKLGNELELVTKLLSGVRDRIRGVYGWTPGQANLARVTTALKQVNNITNMGMSAIASISDFAGAPIRYGLTTAFADGWAPFFKHMITKNEGLEKQGRQLKALGIGVDTELNLRQHAMDDIIDGYKPQSRVERALQWTSDKFFVANLLAPLTDIQKRIAGNVVINEALRGVKAITEGKATKAQVRNLADAGIDANMASRIHRQFFENKFGETIDGVHVPNTADWTDAGARAAFEGAIARDVDIMVVTPGQEKPLLMSQPVGGLLLQFKSFPAAATERILISNLQRRDAAALSGVMTSVALGMLSYKINSVLGGQPVSDRPADWVKEGISRSGLIGWLEEGNAMAAKFSGGKLDVHRLYGADKPLSRYASRSVADSFLGPTVGKLASIGQVGRAAASGEWNQSDTTALRRLMFFQNLFWLRNAINGVESSVNQSFGIPEKAKH
ncbi:MAG: hypothetical protein LC750_00540 [Actinobacteria bacterium]|nr:hypothetical protein [Actinomycetota bacterium]